MDAATIQAVAALGAVMVAAAGLLAGFFYWLHRELKQDLLSEIRRVESKSDSGIRDLREEMHRNNEAVREEMRQLREEVREDMRQLREEVREEMRQLREEVREEMRQTREEILAEMRRSNAQLLAALSGHTHEENTGAAVFRELPAADDD